MRTKILETFNVIQRALQVWTLGEEWIFIESILIERKEIFLQALKRKTVVIEGSVSGTPDKPQDIFVSYD